MVCAADPLYVTVTPLVPVNVALENPVYGIPPAEIFTATVCVAAVEVTEVFEPFDVITAD